MNFTFTALDAVFYLFSIGLVVSSTLVVVFQNPVHSALALVGSFLNGAALFVLLGAELYAMMLVIVYVGAIAVLFLFIIMMLSNDARHNETPFLTKTVVFVSGAALATQLVLLVYGYNLKNPGYFKIRPYNVSCDLTFKCLGQAIYIDFFYIFQLVGVLLLIAMVAAISLTLRKGARSKKQSVEAQHARTSSSSIKLVDTRKTLEKGTE